MESILSGESSESLGFFGWAQPTPSRIQFQIGQILAIIVDLGDQKFGSELFGRPKLEVRGPTHFIIINS